MDTRALTSPWFIMMVGLPGSGKSTYVRKLRHPDDYVVLSTDKYIDEMATINNKTYNEVWQTYIKSAQENMKEDLQHALRWEYNIVHDQLNLSFKTRTRILTQIPNTYYKICVNVTCGTEEWQKRLTNRPGKVISEQILVQMSSRYNCPHTLEGFDKVIHHDSSWV